MNEPLFIVDRSFYLSENSPMCHMVKAGDFLWLTGQTSKDENGKVVGQGDIQAQARQIFTNIRRFLTLAECELTSVIRLTNYLTTSMATEEFTQKYWQIRREFFGDHRPASTGVQVAALMLPEYLIEIDVVAYAPNAVISPDAKIVNT